MNTVLAGDYQGKLLYMAQNQKVSIQLGGTKTVDINKKNVLRYELAGQDSKAGFSVGKAALGAAAFGDIGVVAGVGGKQKHTYQLVIYFRDGKKSLVEVNEKIYRAITIELFGVEDYTTERAIAEEEEKKKHHIVARVIIWFVTTVVCIIITQAIYPSVDGYIQMDWIGELIAFGIPILATIFLPKIIFKKRKKK